MQKSQKFNGSSFFFKLFYVVGDKIFKENSDSARQVISLHQWRNVTE